jgi:hypothetical protein
MVSTAELARADYRYNTNATRTRTCVLTPVELLACAPVRRYSSNYMPSYTWF